MYDLENATILNCLGVEFIFIVKNICSEKVIFLNKKVTLTLKLKKTVTKKNFFNFR